MASGRGKAWRRLSCIAALLSICAASQAAMANCSQSDAEGRWRVYATVLQSPTPHWMNCDLTVTPAGAISSGSCDSPVQRNLELSAGQIKIADTTNCVFTAHFELAGTPNSIQHVTLSPEKSVASGVGASSDAYFTFTMIRTAAPQ
jgi:hypothetical protein